MIDLKAGIDPSCHRACLHKGAEHMFSTIMIPVDLASVGHMDKALSLAADLALRYDARAHVVGVTQSSPTPVARTPEAYAGKLAAFAAERSKPLGIRLEAHTEISHDPAVDLDDVLLRAATTIDADLIVMASHVPGFAEHVIASNAGYVASHAGISVFVVR